MGSEPEAGTNLTACADCGGKVSSRAAACPHCGAPAAPAAPVHSAERYVVKAGAGREETASFDEIAARWRAGALAPGAVARKANEQSWLPVDILMSRAGISKDAVAPSNGLRSSKKPTRLPQLLTTKVSPKVVVAVTAGMLAVVVAGSLLWDEAARRRKIKEVAGEAARDEERKRRAEVVAERAKFNRLETHVSEMLTAAASGKETTPILASTFAAEQLRGFAPDPVKPELRALALGEVDFKGRTLPAGIFEAKFMMVNRAEGEKHVRCVTHACAYDAEFEMYRMVMTKGCEPAERQKLIDTWKSEAKFVAK